MERVIAKLYAHDPKVDVDQKQNTFWKEWKQFTKETGIYEKRNMWNIQDAREGNSALWHEQYSIGTTKV